MQEPKRCSWCLTNPKMILYHDKEWGTPIQNEKSIYQAFLLDTFQAGLSWAIILKKRDAFQKAFSNFCVEEVAQYNSKMVQKLLLNPGIIRNKAKITAAVTNAKLIIDIKKEYGTFAKYLWSFVKNKPMQNSYKKPQDIPATSKEAEKLSWDLKDRGLRFVGPTTIYAFMQGIGMVQDHIVSCFRYAELKRNSKKKLF